METTQGIQKYEADKLPKNSGEKAYFDDIGSALFGDDYKVEDKNGYWEITKL